MQESISAVTNNGEGFLVYCTGNLNITCMSYENNQWNIGTAPNKCNTDVNSQKKIWFLSYLQRIVRNHLLDNLKKMILGDNLKFPISVC